jgi:threonine dehydrogenase-like Zn-dependent dehydrogenase
LAFSSETKWAENLRGKAMCKQALLTAPRILKITNFTMPIPKENEVVLQVSHSGVCGTDLAIYSGSYPVPLPLVLGHEYTGTTIAWGSQVPTHLHNARVTGEINITCKIITPETLCSNCRNGIESHCLTRTTVGIYRAGSFTTHLVVPWQILHLIPQELSLEAASFTEPMAAAIQTFELNPLPKKMILLGCGRLGSLILDYAVKNGVETTVISRSEKSLSLAKKLGAIQVYPSSDSTNLERVLDWTKGQGADLVIEATGSENGLNEALKFVKARGL